MVLAVSCLALRSAESRAQGLFINEVIANNGDVSPQDVGCRTPDMVEIYNSSDKAIALGDDDPAKSYYLSDKLEFDPVLAWRFPLGRAEIPAKGFLLVFCDFDLLEAKCELHAAFRIASEGTEAISLWGPDPDPDNDVDDDRPLIDRFWTPPMRGNVSVGRFPDGGESIVYYPLGSESPPTFGECRINSDQTAFCSQVMAQDRLCDGVAGGPNTNGPGVNIEPRVGRQSHSSNSPRAGEAVTLTVSVRDDKEPVPANIERVEIVFRVDGGTPERVPMVFDSDAGVLDGSTRVPPRPLDRWTLWHGEIPGQAAGSRVEFHFVVRDVEGAESTSPRPLCETVCDDCPGPCDREFGGPNRIDPSQNGCQRDKKDVTCRARGCEPREGQVEGERYLACDAWFTYAVGYAPSERLEGLVVNEVVPQQDGLLRDRTEERLCEPQDNCPPEDSNCCHKREDFVELFNASDAEIGLEGLWLSDSYFRPERWQFPLGSRIGAREHLIVWCDNDGAKCPDDIRCPPPCFWECPGPTDPSRQEYHTDFALEFDGDQIFIFDTEENNLGLIHGLTFQFEDFGLPKGQLPVNMSLSLVPDGDRGGCFVAVGGDNVTPGEPNQGECSAGPLFRRGDANVDCAVDLADAVTVLNYLFLAGKTPKCLDAADADDTGAIDITDGIRILSYRFLARPAPPAPGPEEPGVDPSEDELAACDYDDRCL